MTKHAPVPSVTAETWRALLSAAEEFAALKPWEFIYDNQPVGLIDPATSEIRMGAILGNAKEVFAAVFYRRDGLRWILSMLGDDLESEEFNNVEGLDFLQLEFVRKNALSKDDKAVLKSAAFNPAGKGAVWPQFRSAEPGWHPWHINQAEANQLLSDIPRLTAFCRLLAEQPELYDGRRMTEVAFLPAVMPDRPLMPGDIDWRPMVMPPAADPEPFRATSDQLNKLRKLKRAPQMECEFDCSILPGASFVENGRPCFGRISLLVETGRGLVLGIQVLSGALPITEAVGRGFIEALMAGQSLPGKVFIGGSRFQPVLQPLCDELEIELRAASSLPALEEAIASLGEFLLAGAGPL